MSEAIRLALVRVEQGGGPFGAVIVKDGKIIAAGVNRVTGDRDPTAHAEIIAIREASRVLDTHNLQGCEIYCSSEPCPMCLGAAYWSRIDKIYFGTSKKDAKEAGFDDLMIYEETGKPLNERSLPILQMMRDEAQVAFKKWKDNPNRIEY